MDIVPFNIYSKTLFKRNKNYIKLVALKSFLNYFDTLSPCTRLNYTFSLCAFSAFCQVRYSAKMKKNGINKFIKQSLRRYLRQSVKFVNFYF